MDGREGELNGRNRKEEDDGTYIRGTYNGRMMEHISGGTYNGRVMEHISGGTYNGRMMEHISEEHTMGG